MSVVGPMPWNHDDPSPFDPTRKLRFRRIRSARDASVSPDAACTIRAASVSISLTDTASLLARSTSSAPASGSAASAFPTARALGIDRSPFLRASIVTGAASATSAVSNRRIASPTDTPVVAASQCAAVRCPWWAHRLVWATRRAASARPAEAACSRSRNTPTRSRQSRAPVSSGSNPATTARTCAVNSATGRALSPTASGSRPSERAALVPATATEPAAPGAEPSAPALLDVSSP
jgi:hypothetical protein